MPPAEPCPACIEKGEECCCGMHCGCPCHDGIYKKDDEKSNVNV